MILQTNNDYEIDLMDKILMNKNFKVFEVDRKPDWSAKILTQPDSQMEMKLKDMVSNKSRFSRTHTNGFVIGWPLDLLYKNKAPDQKFKGYIMPSINGMHSIDKFYNPLSRKREFKKIVCKFLPDVSRNMAEAFDTLHQQEIVIGNICECTIMAGEDSKVMLCNTENSQISHNRTVAFGCRGKGKAKFTPPESQNNDSVNGELSLEHDRFGLAVLIFMMLMEGIHPFDVQKGESTQTAYKDRICNNNFPYNKTHSIYHPKRNSPNFEKLYPELKDLFIKCFVDGHTNPASRPSAKEWAQNLDGIIKNQCEAGCSLSLNQPDIKKINLICPWCPIEIKIVSLLSKEPKSTSALAMEFKEKVEKVRNYCKNLEKEGWIISQKKRNGKTIYFFRVTGEILSISNRKKIYAVINTLRKLVQTFMGSLSAVNKFFAQLLRQYSYNKAIQNKIRIFQRYFSNILVSHGKAEAVEILYLFPYQPEVLYWSLNPEHTPKDIQGFLEKYRII